MSPENALPYEIEFRWKEEVIYWEGKQGFVFPGGWGVDPMVTYVPDEAAWNRAVPAWMQDRRNEIVERLSTSKNHVLEFTAAEY